MSDTTWSKVLAIAPELSSTSNDMRDILLGDAIDQVTEAVFGRFEEKAQRYLVAHWATLLAPGTDKNTVGSVTNKSVGDVSLGYGSGSFSIKDGSRYDLTAYGREYINIRKGSVTNFRVFKPGP